MIAPEERREELWVLQAPPMRLREVAVATAQAMGAEDAVP